MWGRPLVGRGTGDSAIGDALGMEPGLEGTGVKSGGVRGEEVLACSHVWTDPISFRGVDVSLIEGRLTYTIEMTQRSTGGEKILKMRGQVKCERLGLNFQRQHLAQSRRHPEGLS